MIDPNGMGVEKHGSQFTDNLEEIAAFLDGHRGMNDGDEDEKKKGKQQGKRNSVDLRDKKAIQELGQKAKDDGFWPLMSFAFSEYELALLGHMMYDREGRGSLPDDSHPALKANEVVAGHAMGKLVGSIGLLAAKTGMNIAKNAKKRSPDDIGKFLNAGKDWHKGSSKGNLQYICYIAYD